VRNDMYVASEAIRLMLKSKNSQFTRMRAQRLRVRVPGEQGDEVHSRMGEGCGGAGAGTGTWWAGKRIVVTVGEKIGKELISCAGSVAELCGDGNDHGADNFGLPV